jgi:hypothetical protein
LPGYPYGTAVPLILDQEHRPILLISALAEHTRNLMSDTRASLAVVGSGQRNVQDAARVTLVGRFEPFVPGQQLVDRYLRYQPAAAQYLQLDFSFFRLGIERARYIGGLLGIDAYGVDYEAGDQQLRNTFASPQRYPDLAKALPNILSGIVAQRD